MIRLGMQKTHIDKGRYQYVMINIVSSHHHVCVRERMTISDSATSDAPKHQTYCLHAAYLNRLRCSACGA